MEQFLNIEYLKDNHTRIYYFGLGFIQVILNQYERVHFYSDELKKLAIDEGWHNHRYNFTSTILKGEFHQEKGFIIPGNTHILYNVNCGNNKELPYTNEIQIELKKDLLNCQTFSDDDFSSSSYDIAFNEFHKVETFGNTITYLKRSDYITEFAQSIRPKGVEFVCPFTHKFSDDELWKMVEEIINN